MARRFRPSFVALAVAVAASALFGLGTAGPPAVAQQPPDPEIERSLLRFDRAVYTLGEECITLRLDSPGANTAGPAFSISHPQNWWDTRRVRCGDSSPSPHSSPGSW